MDLEKVALVPMEEQYAKEIAKWQYEGIYAFYTRKSDDISGWMDGSHYACIDEEQKVIGYFCFGLRARIPTVEKNVYDKDLLDIGLGLRPDLCGHGMGEAFLKKGMAYGKENLNTHSFRLSVAAFNERAVVVYKRCGFEIVNTVTNSYFKNQFYIMELMKR